MRQEFLNWVEETKPDEMTVHEFIELIAFMHHDEIQEDLELNGIGKQALPILWDTYIHLESNAFPDSFLTKYTKKIN